jgi:hypothetical protein|tara:strand:- start:653 stop:1087 length:435 start_codon:yes stop_codon:yes gene_type:complete
MFYKHKYEDRLASWSDFRKTLETCENPIQEAINYYDNAPQVSINTDPWDQNTWPTPWQLVAENQYCNFCKLLGVCYSLQLTNRFTGKDFEIYIGTDIEKSNTMYVLQIETDVVTVDQNSNNIKNEIKQLGNVAIEKRYSLPKLN